MGHTDIVQWQTTAEKMGAAFAKVGAAWNNYVFARSGMAPGAGMRVVPEPEAWEALSATFRAFSDAWHMGPKPETMLDTIRQHQQQALDAATAAAADDRGVRAAGWRARAAALRELLEEIPGTAEAEAVAERERQQERIVENEG